MKYVRDNIIGNDHVFKSPFGLRKVLYLDYIASGRGLKFIEDYIQKQVLPEYANTHTTTSVTSLQTSLFRQQARDIIRSCCNANESDCVIFVGSGCTGAIDKILHSLDLSKPPVTFLNNLFQIVFMCPYAHHSLFLPWGEAGAKVIRVPHDKNGLVDKTFLESNLKKHAGSDRQLIGCFTAASNVTGIISDIDNITFLLHKYGALAFWDYATAAPYVQIDCNPHVDEYSDKYLYKDAVFISPHKFLGGVSTPGVLIAKRNLFKSQKPVICGGGTVVYVTQSSRVYHTDPEVREEGGTPAIVESIRAGLTFQLKEAITPKYILSRENYLFRKAMPVFKTNKNLVILGNTDSDRLPVFSFLIYHPQTGRFLHHNFISTILNDVFGIQNRGGCACAGPYAIKSIISTKLLISKSVYLPFRPGFTRLNLPYFLLEDEVQFIIKAVTMVADDGWKLLPQVTEYLF
ncbi:hypothetical protein LOTGIDRAFT_104877 [Lottia gigantea]|uniref:Aminotransferase class V domain-containing protein n=1 Tax=Lottia gigantea TaxID=225164 RepID=V4BXN6_LOTGI|nr:hypothetical protein LOTGIDRAFT_104877 [Lottia gigantea]ESO93844.1 hypothetical protein LOTGIDRAFT_104877 [Lottia gigantea]